MAATLTDFPPGSSVLVCPICHDAIHAHGPPEIDFRSNAEICEEAETASVRHFEALHPFRLALFEAFGWKWPVRGFFG